MKTFADIIAEVALKYNTPPAKLLERTRKRQTVWMRDEAISRMYFEVPYATLENVGQWFGLDYSSVRAAVIRQKKRIAASEPAATPDSTPAVML